MPYRTYLGPYGEAKINLTHFSGKIKRGQRIRVTDKEAEAMDKLPWWGGGKPKVETDTSEVVVKRKHKHKTRRLRKKAKDKGGK